MKEIRVCAALLIVLTAAAALFYAPKAAHELTELVPVETLTVDLVGGSVCVEGDGVCGIGTDWASAMEDLRASAPGTVFLETADRVIVTERAAAILPQLCRDAALRPAVRLFYLRGAPEDGAAEFAAAKDSPATRHDPRSIPVIVPDGEGRFRLA